MHHLREPTCQYEFVFVSPEAVVTEPFQKCLEKMKIDDHLRFFVIDEAHCIDTWGSDFCPAYQQLGTLRKYDTPFTALTSTAAGHTVNEIKSALQMDDASHQNAMSKREPTVQCDS